MVPKSSGPTPIDIKVTAPSGEVVSVDWHHPRQTRHVQGKL